ncbi:MAG: hypothetical protein LBT87_00985 [Treponema sp.]|nr:hypothetical protein [Treponema sp.]
MAVLNMADQITAIEAAKRVNNPDAFHIIECLRMTNEMLADLPAIQANDGTVHTTLRRLNQPGGTHRIYNQGVDIKASQTDTVRDRIAMLGAYSVVDKAMADHTGNRAAFRQSEAVAILKGMGIDQAKDLVYGNNTADKAQIDGLAVRLSKVDNKTVFSMGGSGNDLTSLYLIAAGADLCHLIYPKGSSSIGVTRSDQGEKIWEDQEKKRYQALVEYFEAQYGITIRDPAAVIRICNIEAAVNGDDLIDAILSCRRRLPPGASTYALYANLDVLIKIDKTARDRGNVVYTAADPWGKEITHIRDIRCRQMDVILSTEEAVA